MLLQIENLTVNFGNKIAVKDITFAIPNGKIVAVVGSSGSGKTVTALSVLGLIKYSHGATWQGKILYSKNQKTVDLAALSEQEWEEIRGREIAMIFQDPVSSLNPIMKIGKQLEEVIKRDHSLLNQNEINELIFKALEGVGLSEPKRISHSYPFALSSGMCQRVMIAMALLSSPALLIADEPTTFLDAMTEGHILRLLKDINETKNCSILLITHNLDIAKKYADEILVMHDGEIVEGGRTEEIFSTPKHPYTKKLIESIY